jgi:hypothetical protein
MLSSTKDSMNAAASVKRLKVAAVVESHVSKSETWGTLEFTWATRLRFAEIAGVREGAIRRILALRRRLYASETFFALTCAQIAVKNFFEWNCHNFETLNSAAYLPRTATHLALSLPPSLSQIWNEISSVIRGLQLR